MNKIIGIGNLGRDPEMRYTPFMRSWPQYRVLEAREVVRRLPEAEHGHISGHLKG